MATLYIVGTPIGNLGDFSPRGQEVLSQVDFIAAEDTRVSRPLLNHFGISTPLISYHQHNQKQREEEILTRLQSGQSAALISDAGMPAISDPGEELIRACHKAGIPVVVVPGPTAALSALAISGLPTRRFVFEGFLDGKLADKRKLLKSLSKETRTLIFYEAPHKLLATLTLMADVFGDRPLALCRELTKLYEEVQLTTLKAAVDHYTQQPPRGEFVLVVEGAEEVTEVLFTFEEAAQMVRDRQAHGVPLSKAAKEVAELTGYKKGLLYKEALNPSAE